MRRTLADGKLPGLVLVIVIAWALAAVMMLTGTLVNAREIDDRVQLINTQVSPIDKDLDAVKLAERTSRVAAQIDTAAAPLSGQLDEVIGAAGNIDRNAGSILSTAGEINTTVGEINTTAGEINTTVRSIGANVFSINANLNSTLRSVLSINRHATSINESANGINTSVNSIHADATTILGTGRSIDTGVAAINGRAIRAIDLAEGLTTDFHGILTSVGRARDLGITGHVSSIDCAPLINSAGPTRSCER